MHINQPDHSKPIINKIPELCCPPMTSGMNDENSTQQIKKYTFYTNSRNSNSNSKEELEILIPEVSVWVDALS